MKYFAKDGKEFHNGQQGRRYDQWLADQTTAQKSGRDVKNAPGGPLHRDAVREHGLARKIEITRESGHTVVKARFNDGFVHQSVHPEAYLAHEISRDLLGIEPPPALQTHARARSQPTGPKEKERIDREDRQPVEEEENL